MSENHDSLARMERARQYVAEQEDARRAALSEGQPKPSEAAMAVVEAVLKRDAFGQAKYGTTMDRRDLTPQQWAQHLEEELLDGANYLQRVKPGLGLLAEAYDILITLANERGWDNAKQWVESYNSAFGETIETTPHSP